MKKYIYLLICLLFFVQAFAQTTNGRKISGKVLDENKAALPAATITVLNSGTATTTDKNGFFEILVPGVSNVISVSFVGYETQQFRLNKDSAFYTIRLAPSSSSLKEVVVSSGYQQLNQKSTTGSYAVIGPELLQRSVSTDIISKLDGVTPALAFDNRAPDQQNLSIRGRSTILSDNSPLIVVDNFPYDGDIHNINPNDVESITILKDAASSAIWGARAGNGVIVITTKHGKFNQPTQVSLTSNVTVGNKPDLFYNPAFLGSSDFINVEEQLFNQGFYTTAANSPGKTLLSPVVDILTQEQNGLISAADADAQINAFKNLDVRKDFEKYFYQKSINQQYNLNISGGGEKYNYLVSGGYDYNRSNLVGNYNNRYTLNSVNTFRPTKNLTIGADINYTSTKAVSCNPGYSGINSGNGTTGLYPYAQLANANGNPLAVAKDYPLSFTNTAVDQGYLDWQYRPLQELKLANNVSEAKDIRLKFNARYTMFKGFDAEVLYQYENTSQNGNFIYSQDTYFARNLINEYTQPGNQYVVPLGGILNNNNGTLGSQSGRFQVNYNKLLDDVNQVSVIAGAEIRDVQTNSISNRLYGYDSNLLISQPVDYVNFYTLNPGETNSGTVPYGNSQQKLTDRYISEYLNVNYNYSEKYFLSGSARKDASNLFGVNTNQKWVPLYSVGGGWMASRESFYHLDWLPYLKLRATYGYTGNVNKSITAYTTATYQNDFITGLPNLLVLTPPDPDLRWEKVRTMNFGVDFETKNKRLSGSLDYYSKKGTDQLGRVALDPTTGYYLNSNYSTALNSSDFVGSGVDIELNSVNTTGALVWKTRLLFNYATDKVTKYEFSNPVTDYFSPNSPPLLGRPVLGIYSYKWAGLDPATGDPMVYLNGSPSKDYAAIASNATTKDLVYNGPALPPYFGSVMNTFVYKQFTLSANITYKFGYYFHRSSISYSDLINNWQGHKDFDQRWQKPGDELKTNVPSLSLSDDPGRDAAYINSSALVVKGDNIRLQDVQLAYTFGHFKNQNFPLRNLTLYGYANNLGILWRANKEGLDPDYVYGYSAIKPVTTISLGFRANF